MYVNVRTMRKWGIYYLADGEMLASLYDSELPSWVCPSLTVPRKPQLDSILTMAVVTS